MEIFSINSLFDNPSTPLNGNGKKSSSSKSTSSSKSSSSKPDESQNKHFFFSHSLEIKNGKVQKDEETTLSINKDSGKLEKKEFGDVVESKKITKRQFDRYLEKELPNTYIDENIFSKAASILGILVDTLNDVDSSDIKLEKGDEDKNVKKSQLIRSDRISRKDICDEFLDFVNVQDETAEKIRKAYEKYYNKFTDGETCKVNKKNCQKELEKLEELYEKFNDPVNGCVRHY